MADADGAVTVESGGSLGPKKLTTIHAVGQALGIGPIFSAGAVTGLVAAVAGFNTPLSILLGSIGALGIAYVVSLYARRYVGAGAMYEYLARAVNNSFGIFSGGTYLVGVLMLGSGGIYLGLCFLVQGFFASHLHANIPWWAGGLAGLVVALVLNYFGVRLAVRGVLTLCGLSAIPFLILSVVIIAKGGQSGNTLSVFNPSETSLNTVFNGILFAILLFVGFEAAASIAEEMHAPRDRIPIAVLGTVAVAALFFLLVCYAATIGYGKEALAHNAWGSSPDAMGDLAQHYVGTWLSVLIDLGIILDALSLGIAIMVTSSRLLFALGRDRLLPQWLGTTSRYNTPVTAIGVLGAWGIIVLLWTAATDYAPNGGANVIETFTISANAGSFLVETIYIFLAVFALRIVWRDFSGFGAVWRLIVVLVGLAAPILAFKGSLDPFPSSPNNQAVFIWIGGMILALIWCLYLRATRSEEVRAAAAYAADDAEGGVRDVELGTAQVAGDRY
jgi:amino acid transporter